MSGYPVNVRERDGSYSDVAAGLNVGVDLMTRMMIEGDPLSASAFQGTPVATATGTINTTIVSSPSTPTIGKCAFVETITASLDTAATAQVLITGDANSRFPGFTAQVCIGAGVPVEIKVNKLFRGFQYVGGATLAVRNNQTAGSVSYRGAVFVSGTALTDDFDFDAPYTVLYAGDSTINGTGPTLTAAMYPFVLKRWLADQGYRSRVLLKSRSGSTSADHELWRAAGWHSGVVGKPALGVYNVGINDAITAVSTSALLANVQSYWSWWSETYPNAPLIVLGVTPLENNTSEAAAAGYRTAVSAWITSVNSPKLKFADPTDLWDRTVSSNYAASDTPGSRVHYVDGPHALVADLLGDVINANALWPVR